MVKNSSGKAHHGPNKGGLTRQRKLKISLCGEKNVPVLSITVNWQLVMKSVLLIIDVQNDMFNMPEKLHNPDGLLSAIERMISLARAKGMPVVYVQHNSDKGNFFKNGSEGWKIHGRIAPLEGDSIVQKTHPDSFYGTELESVLDSLGAVRLVVCGIQSELCVDTTTRAARSRGYSVTLVSDGHSTFDRAAAPAPEIIKLENEVLKGWFADVTVSTEISF